MTNTRAFYILQNMTLADDVSEKLKSEVNEALEIARMAIIHKENELKFSDQELQMIKIGLDTAVQENQLPNFGEKEYDDVIKLKSKLGILCKEDFCCEKCGNRNLHYSLRGSFGGTYGEFLCKKCGFSFVDKYSVATDEDWENFREATKDIMW